MKRLLIIFLVIFGVQTLRAQSTNANLSGLSLSSGTLSPTFVSTTTSYTVSDVATATATITVTPTKADANASIAVQVNGDGYSTVSSGTPSSSLPLYLGNNYIQVKVTAQDNTTIKIYSIDVFRMPSDALVTLSDMDLSSGTISPVVSIGQQNSSTVRTSTVTVSSVSVTATAANVNTTTLTLAYRVNGGSYVSMANSTYTSEFPLNLGVNVLEVKVSDYGWVRNYRVLITRVNADLNSLTINAGTLTPAFSQINTSYTVDLKNFSTTDILGIVPTVSDPTSTLTRSINGGSYTSITSGAVLSTTLNAGVNTIIVRVTSQGGLINKNYSIRVITGQQGVGANGEKTMLNSGYDSSGKLTNVGYVNSSGKIINSYNAHFANCDGSVPTEVVEVTSVTGKVWMDRDLGAQRAAMSATDNFGYGCLYQWGRGNDGHANILYSTSTPGTAVNGFTTDPSVTNTPGHNLFIWGNSNGTDWRSPANDALWQGVSGTNNPCPAGFRVPTEAEFTAEVNAYDIRTLVTYFSAPLRIATIFNRNNNSTSFVRGSGSSYWTSTVTGVNAYGYGKNAITSKLYATGISRRYGMAVRCIKD